MVITPRAVRLRRWPTRWGRFLSLEAARRVPPPSLRTLTMKPDPVDINIAALAAYLAAVIATAKAKPGDNAALIDVLDGFERRIGEFRLSLGKAV